MALIQYCHGTNSGLDSDINSINTALVNLIANNTIKRIKVQALPNTKIGITGKLIYRNITGTTSAEQNIEENDLGILGDEIQNDTIPDSSTDETQTQQTTFNNSQRTQSPESELVIGNSGVLDIDFFSWNAHFQPTLFRIDETNYPNNMLIYPLIITVEYYDKEFKDPYSEVWVGEIG